MLGREEGDDGDFRFDFGRDIEKTPFALNRAIERGERIFFLFKRAAQSILQKDSVRAHRLIDRKADHSVGNARMGRRKKAVAENDLVLMFRRERGRKRFSWFRKEERFERKILERLFGPTDLLESIPMFLSQMDERIFQIDELFKRLHSPSLRVGGPAPGRRFEQFFRRRERGRNRGGCGRGGADSG